MAGMKKKSDTSYLDWNSDNRKSSGGIKDTKKNVSEYSKSNKYGINQSEVDKMRTVAEYLPAGRSQSEWKKYEANKADQNRWIAMGAKASKSARMTAKETALRMLRNKNKKKVALPEPNKADVKDINARNKRYN